MSFECRFIRLAVGVAMIFLIAGSHADAGSVFLPTSAGQFNPKATSLAESRFHGTIKQQLDFSCGSAAVATLLHYHYEHSTDETAVFREMWKTGDKEKIRKEGFSLLDMKRYLEGIGLRTGGFKASLDKLADVGVPAVALINTRGYKHFVVVKGVTADEVLVGDPALGARVIERPKFEGMWNGILFVIRDKTDIGGRHFNDAGEWTTVAKRGPIHYAVEQETLGNFQNVPDPVTVLSGFDF